MWETGEKKGGDRNAFKLILKEARALHGL